MRIEDEVQECPSCGMQKKEGEEEGGSKKAREMKQGTDSERRSYSDKTREGEWAENLLYTINKDTGQSLYESNQQSGWRPTRGPFERKEKRIDGRPPRLRS